MMARTSLSLALATIACASALAGCPGGDDTVDGSTDGSPFAPRLEIGTGDIGVYEPILDGDTVLLVRGPQGGQHVWVSLRAANLDTRPALIRLSLERARDGYTTSIPFQVRLSFQDEVPRDADYTQLSGLALVVPDPEDAFDGEMVLRARVAENRTGGASVEGMVRVYVAWDPENPPGFRGDDAGVDGDAGADVHGDAGADVHGDAGTDASGDAGADPGGDAGA